VPATPFWLDAPEFIATGVAWGQAHPPGHPAIMSLFKGFLLLPLGSAALRANLASVAFGALSAAAVGMLTLSMTAALGLQGRSARVLGAAATLGFGLSASCVLQSLSVEVYTANAAAVLWATALAVRHPGDARAGGLIGVLVGLGLANHHFLTILALPALAAFFARGQGGRAFLRATIPGAVAAVVVAAGAYLYLPARAGGWPAWADASSLGGTLWIASAQVFAGSLGGFESALGGPLRNAGLALGLLADTLTWPGLLLAGLGIGVVVVRRRGWMTVGVVLWILGGLASKVSMGLLDPDNPDDHGYFLTAIGGLVVMEGVGVSWIAQRASGAVRPSLMIAVLALAIAALPLPAGLATARDRAAFDESKRLTDLVFDGLPPNAVLLVSHYPVLFMTLHDQIVEGRRPDVTVVQQSLYQKARGGTFYARRIAAMDPDLKPLIDRFLDRGTLDWQALRMLADRRPVRLEPASDLEIPLSDVTDAGWTFAVLGREAGDGSPPPAGDVSSTSIRQVLPRWPHLQTETRRVVLRHLAASAQWLHGQGFVDAAVTQLDAALELNPADRTLRAMRARFAP
jgi:hypothetical protein